MTGFCSVLSMFHSIFTGHFFMIWTANPSQNSLHLGPLVTGWRAVSLTSKPLDRVRNHHLSSWGWHPRMSIMKTYGIISIHGYIRQPIPALNWGLLTLARSPIIVCSILSPLPKMMILTALRVENS